MPEKKTSGQIPLAKFGGDRPHILSSEFGETCWTQMDKNKHLRPRIEKGLRRSKPW